MPFEQTLTKISVMSLVIAKPMLSSYQAGLIYDVQEKLLILIIIHFQGHEDIVRYEMFVQPLGI